MPDLVDDFGDPDRSNRAGWLTRVAHWLPVAVLLNLTFSALEWVELIRLEEWPWYFQWMGSLPFILVLSVGMFHQAFARICLRCMESVPADAPVRAQTRRKLIWLRFEHWTWRLRGAMPMVIIMLYSAGWVVLLLALDVEPGDWSWAYAPMDLFVAAFVWASWVHHRYRPWCPYCKPWDGDGGIREPSPDPTGSGTKVSS